MKKFITAALITIICSLFSLGATAGVVAQTNNVIGLMGVDSTSGVIYVAVSGYSGGSCSQIRFNNANADTDKILSVLTAAKLAGKRVRIDLADGADCNSGWRAYIQ